MKALISALQKLHKAPQGQASGSQFTNDQRKALDTFIQQTRALSCITSGRGVVYRILQLEVLEQHIRSLSPSYFDAMPDSLPNRASNIGQFRDSKVSHARHNTYYLLMKAMGESIVWKNTTDTLNLSECCDRFGVGTIEIDTKDSWHSDQTLWLVENQAVFDRIDWLPEGTEASIHWYRGHLNTNLLDWLSTKERASSIVLFPDYDGVGLQNFVRLHQRVGNQCSLWLMPDWEAKLKRYGSNDIWRNTHSDVQAAAAYLSRLTQESTAQGESIEVLLHSLRTNGLALEQETVWL